MLVILGTALGITLWFTDASADFTRASEWFRLSMIFSVSGYIGVFLSMLLSLVLPTKEVLEEELELVSLSEKSSLSGGIFLMAGSIGEREYYRFFQKLPGGGFVRKKVYASASVTIFETEREGGRLRKYVKQLADPKAHWLALDVEVEPPRYEFEIPKGSIKQEFTLT